MTYDELPQWLYKSLTVKRYDLASYGDELKTRWKDFLKTNPTEEEMIFPYTHMEGNFPSCLHDGMNKFEPDVATPFPYCLRENMKIQAIREYAFDHPEVVIMSGDISKLECELEKEGVQFACKHQH